jgi:hypothetical protein
MAITEQKDIREVRLEKSAGQVRIVVDTVILRDGEEIMRTPGNEVYTQESAQQLRDEVTNGAEYATLMGW